MGLEVRRGRLWPLEGDEGSRRGTIYISQEGEFGSSVHMSIGSPIFNDCIRKGSAFTDFFFTTDTQFFIALHALYQFAFTWLVWLRSCCA